MADELALAQILGNALALPRTIGAQQQEYQWNRQLFDQYQNALAGSGQTLPFGAPTPPALGAPGSLSGRILGNPVAQTIGGFGQVLQAITGAQPAAPRPPIAQLGRFAQFQQQLGQSRARTQLVHDIQGGADSRTLAADFAGMGASGPAAKMLGSGAGGSQNPFTLATSLAIGKGLKPGTEEYTSYVAQAAGEIRKAAGMGGGGAGAEGSSEYRAWASQQPAGADRSIEAFWHAKGTSGAEAASLRTDATQRAKIALQDYVRTNATKTMRERAPKVLEGADKVTEQLASLDLGPFAGRGHEFWQQVIGGKDPQYAKLRASMLFLTSQLTFMHTGSRMPVQIADKFDALLGHGEQDPANIIASIEAIRDYAAMVGEPSPQPPPPGGAPANAPAATPTPAAGGSSSQAPDVDSILKKHGY